MTRILKQITGSLIVGTLFTAIAAGQTGDISSRLAKSLTAASAYEYGGSREPLSGIDAIMKDAVQSTEIAKQVEAQFIDFLESDATLAGKQFICRKLSVIGSNASVPVLSGMLADDATFDMALYALEKNPSVRVDKVLVKTVPKAEGKHRIGLMNTLGIRRTHAAVGMLKQFVLDEDQETAVAAIRALARIGTEEASRILQGAFQKTSGPVRAEAMNGYLRCADQMLSAGMVDRAESMYRDFMVPDAVRSAALAGWIRCRPENAGAIILDVLDGDDMQLQSTAIRLLGRLDRVDRLEEIAGVLPSLSAFHRAQLITALAERRDTVVRRAVIEAADDENAEVRIAAINALADLGDGSTVDLILARAVNGGPEQEAARESLYRIRGMDADRAIVSRLASEDPDVKIELLAAVGNRNIISAVQQVMDLTGDPEPRVRQNAIKTLGLIGQSDILPDIIDLLIEAKTDNERREAEETVVVLSRKIADEDPQSRFVLASLPKAGSIASRSSLLGVLGGIGDRHALNEIRKGLKDSNGEIRKASVRALSRWPDAEPIEDLFGIAETSEDEILKTLALRGCIRLIGIDGTIKEEEKVEWFGRTIPLASGVAEKRMVLSGLADLRSVEAMEMAGQWLDDTDLVQEAEAAVIRIADRIWRDASGRVLPLLHRIVRSANNEDHIKDAQRLIESIETIEK